MAAHPPNFRNFLLLASALASAACSSKSSEKPQPAPDKRFDDLVDYLSTPQYGSIRAITGKVLYGHENVFIAVCDTEREKCSIPKNVDGSEQLCWFETKGAANKTINQNLPKRASFDFGGEYWVEGQGRIAVQPGQFGHLGGYTCQVELTKIDVLEEGPPWILGPPPPPSK